MYLDKDHTSNSQNSNPGRILLPDLKHSPKLLQGLFHIPLSDLLFFQKVQYWVCVRLLNDVCNGVPEKEKQLLLAFLLSHQWNIEVGYNEGI